MIVRVAWSATLLIPTCSDGSHIPDPLGERTWIDNMPETGDDLRAGVQRALPTSPAYVIARRLIAEFLTT